MHRSQNQPSGRLKCSVAVPMIGGNIHLSNVCVINTHHIFQFSYFTPLLVRIFKVTMTLWFIRREINIRLFGCRAVALSRTFLSPLLPDYIPSTSSTGCFCFVTVVLRAQLSRFCFRVGSVSEGLAVCPSFTNSLRVEELLSLLTHILHPELPCISFPHHFPFSVRALLALPLPLFLSRALSIP